MYIISKNKLFHDTVKRARANSKRQASKSRQDKTTQQPREEHLPQKLTFNLRHTLQLTDQSVSNTMKLSHGLPFYPRQKQAAASRFTRTVSKGSIRSELSAKSESFKRTEQNKSSKLSFSVQKNLAIKIGNEPLYSASEFVRSAQALGAREQEHPPPRTNSTRSIIEGLGQVHLRNDGPPSARQQQPSHNQYSTKNPPTSQIHQLEERMETMERHYQIQISCQSSGQFDRIPRSQPFQNKQPTANINQQKNSIKPSKPKPMQEEFKQHNLLDSAGEINQIPVAEVVQVKLAPPPSIRKKSQEDVRDKSFASASNKDKRKVKIRSTRQSSNNVSDDQIQEVTVRTDVLRQGKKEAQRKQKQKQALQVKTETRQTKQIMQIMQKPALGQAKRTLQAEIRQSKQILQNRQKAAPSQAKKQAKQKEPKPKPKLQVEQARITKIWQTINQKINLLSLLVGFVAASRKLMDQVYPNWIATACLIYKRFLVERQKCVAELEGNSVSALENGFCLTCTEAEFQAVKKAKSAEIKDLREKNQLVKESIKNIEAKVAKLKDKQSHKVLSIGEKEIDFELVFELMNNEINTLRESKDAKVLAYLCNKIDCLLILHSLEGGSQFLQEEKADIEKDPRLYLNRRIAQLNDIPSD